MATSLRNTVEKLGNLVVAGQMNLSSVTVRGQVCLSGASLGNGSGDALLAAGTRVSGTLLLDRDFTANGTVDLSGARIGDSLVCENATLDGGSGAALQARI